MLSFGLILVFFLPLLCAPCGAQTHAFQWNFADPTQQISTTLPQCQSLKLALSSSTSDPNALGTSPYYVIAFEPAGFSTTCLVGTDPNNLNWQVNHATGTQLMLGMADAKGNAGGMSTPLFTVIAGQDASCLPSVPSTSLAITPNVTTNLATCDPWGLTVTGGVAPYNITLISVGSTVVTNFTLTPGFDLLTYINKANPNGEILAAVSDSTGIFGKTTPIVNTVGSANYTCPGLVSTIGQSSQLPSSSKSHGMTTVAAVCLTIGVLVVLVASILFVLYMRRKIQMKHGIQDGQDTLPRVWNNEADDDSPRTALLSTLRVNRSYRKPPISSTMASSLFAGSSTRHTYHEIVPYVPRFDESRPGHSAEIYTPTSYHPEDHLLPSPPHSPDYTTNHTAIGHSRPNSLPTAGTSSDAERRYAKHADSHTSSRENNARRAALALASSSTANRTQLPILNRPYSTDNRLPIDVDVEPDIIIQHRDGGVVQELPPPYLDRSRDRPAPSDNIDVVGS